MLFAYTVVSLQSLSYPRRVFSVIEFLRTSVSRSASRCSNASGSSMLLDPSTLWELDMALPFPSLILRLGWADLFG